MAAIRGELGFDDRRAGLVFSAFAFGYALAQIPSGALADRFGPRRMLAGVVVLWSVFTALTGAVTSVGVLILVRALFGIAEAGRFRAVRGPSRTGCAEGSRAGDGFCFRVRGWARRWRFRCW